MSRILIVDNNPADVRLVSEALRELGRDDEVAVAVDGAEGLARIEQDERYDLVLLDIRMPKLSGVDVLRKLGDRATNRNVVMLTTTNARREHDECLELGARRVLVKPSGFDRLCTLLAEVLP